MAVLAVMRFPPKDAGQQIRWHLQVTRKGPGREPKGLHELVAQDIARRHRPYRLACRYVRQVDAGHLVTVKSLSHFCPLMVVDDLHLVSVVVPPDEADAPLNVDPDAVLPCPIALQRFQAVARRHLEVVQTDRGIQRPKLPPSRQRKGGRKPFGRLFAKIAFVRRSRNVLITGVT